VRQALYVVVVVVIVAGCGGGKSLSKEEYASRADAVCAKYNEQIKALKDPSNLSELADVADKTLPILDNAINDLKKLKPPANKQRGLCALVDDWLSFATDLQPRLRVCQSISAQWLTQVQGLKNDLREIRDKANAKDIQAVQQVVPRATQHNARSNELATQLGMTVCNRD
jgi:hypothetical protein